MNSIFKLPGKLEFARYGRVVPLTHCFHGIVVAEHTPRIKDFTECFPSKKVEF